MSKNYFLTVLSVGILYSLLSKWFRFLYSEFVTSEYNFMGFVIGCVLIGAVGYLLLLVWLRKEGGSAWGKTLLKGILSTVVMGMFFCVVVGFGFFRSNEVWDQLISGQSSLIRSLRLALTAEEVDVLFVCFLAFVTRMPYLKTQQFYKREFVIALLLWSSLFFINEMIIQRSFFTERIGEIKDVFRNAFGVSIGLLLSDKWFLGGSIELVGKGGDSK